MSAGPSTGALVRYSLPASAVGGTMLLVDAYLVKFATDTLGIAAGAVALLISLPRVWDAVSDPMVGYLSDRTRSRLGRRRPWILSGVLPMALAFWMLWSPPSSIEGLGLQIWVGAALLVFYTGTTLIDIPHFALGAELCDDYHARTRLFGVRRLWIGAGALGAVAALFALDSAGDVAARRSTGFGVGLAGAALVLLATPWSVWRTRERSLERSVPESPWRAYRDVLRNPHARLLLGVAFLQQGSIASLAAALPYYSDYVLRTPGQAGLYIGVVLVASFIGIPIVLRVAPHFDKRSVVALAMTLVSLVLAALGSLSEGAMPLAIAVAAMAGLAAAACDTVGPSLQADIIDYDEYITGERKEAAYFALWTLVAKLSRAGAISLVALTLATIDFTPNTEQSESTLTGLRLLTGWLPALGYGAGTLLFSRYRLTREEHARIRTVLDTRRTAAGS